VQAVNEMVVGCGEEVCWKDCPYIRQLANSFICDVLIMLLIIILIIMYTKIDILDSVNKLSQKQFTSSYILTV